MQIMDRKEQLGIIYDYLRSKGIVHTKKEFAKVLDMNYSTISNAFGGNEKCLTDSLFVSRIGSTFSDIFDKEWLKTGHGSMLKSDGISISIGELVNKGSGSQKVVGLNLEDTESMKNMIVILQAKCAEQDAYINQLLEIINNLSKTTK